MLELLNCWGYLLLAMVSFFLQPHLWHMNIPRRGIKSELQLPACATAPTPPDVSCTCDLWRSLRQHPILHPLNKDGNQTRLLRDTSRILNPLSHNGNSCCGVLQNTYPVPWLGEILRWNSSKTQWCFQNRNRGVHVVVQQK